MGEDIAAWFNEQPAWMREAVEIYIKTGEISESKNNELADICISEAKGDDCSKYKVSDTNLLSMGMGSSFAIKKISDINGVTITQEDCDTVDAMMTKYSAYDHSMSPESPLIEFDVSEIEKDMNDFSQWLTKRKAYVK
jgi:hypothetical protein